MRVSWPRAVAGLLVVGTAVRLVLAFAFYGEQTGVDAFALVARIWGSDWERLYDFGWQWPYPPLYVPVAAAMLELSQVTGAVFHGTVQLPMIAADAALALVVGSATRAAGAGDRAALAAVALVALGPIFILINGYHAQIDSLAILPAVVALLLWQRDVRRRALIAGLLIGLGTAIKLPPAFVVLALLPSARDRREAITLLASAAAVPLLALAPWLLNDPELTLRTLRENRGVPGFGGLSALVQPDLALYWIRLDELPPISSQTNTLTDLQLVLAGAAGVVACVVAARARAAPAAAATLVYLAVWAASPNFAYQYLLWGLPFMILAGHRTGAAVLQAAASVPAFVLYMRVATDVTAWPGVVAEWALYLGIVATAVLYGRRLLRSCGAAAASSR